jgi:hypothetical protein
MYTYRIHPTVHGTCDLVDKLCFYRAGVGGGRVGFLLLCSLMVARARHTLHPLLVEFPVAIFITSTNEALNKGHSQFFISPVSEDTTTSYVRYSRTFWAFSYTLPAPIVHL